jgi:DNA polymerase-3 subunit delta'
VDFTNALQMPWHGAVFDQARQALQRDRPPQAILLAGGAGLGSEQLAASIAALRLCSANKSAPCGECRSCRALAQDTHPDYLTLGVEADATEIKIDAVREFCAALALTAHGGGYRVGLIAPVDRLNRFAANSLLKTLEEPPRQTLLLLAGTRVARLPATIRSRCLQLKLASVASEDCVRWLVSHTGHDAIVWSEVIEAYGPQPCLLAESQPKDLLAMAATTRAALKDLFTGGGDASALAREWNDERFALRLQLIETLITKQAEDLGRRSAAPLRAAAGATTLRRMLLFLQGLTEQRWLAETPVNRAYSLQHLLLWLRSGSLQAPHEALLR